MSEIERRGEVVQGAAGGKETVKAGLNLLADVVYKSQVQLGEWGSGDPAGDEDMSPAFAALFTKVGKAYEGYRDGVDPAAIVWISETGDEAKPGDGIPQGLPADFAEVLLDVLSIARRMGMDVSVFADVAEAKARFAASELAGAGAGDEGESEATSEV